jgi:hypothetical protein
MMKLLFLAMFAATAQAICPNKCSGHGTCGASDKCTCFPNWTGADCAGRKCAYGLSWVAAPNALSGLDVPAAGGLGGRHAYTECSSRGICERGSGECRCFEGYEGKGCRRTTCPNSCSGHGRCVYNKDITAQTVGENAYLAKYDGAGLDNFNDVSWDAMKTRQCMCDRGWEDVDCSKRICPKGDDPLTDCNTKNQKDDVQLLLFYGEDEFDILNIDQFFTLTFTDMFNGNYTTTPIQLQALESGAKGAMCSTAGNCHSGTSARIKSALEALPNFAVPTVTVTYFNATMYRFLTAVDPSASTKGIELGWDANSTVNQGGAASMVGFLVTFSDAATSGLQQTLDCYTGSMYDSDEPGVTPRFGNKGVKPAYCRVYHVGEPTNNDPVYIDMSKEVNGIPGVAYGDAGALWDQYGLELNATETGAYDAAAIDHAANFITEGSVSYNWAPLADTVPYDSISTYKEHATCSNRGNCDDQTGLCDCFEGHTGEACQEQTVFF